MSAVAAHAESATVVRVRRLVRDRAALQAGFAEAWPLMSRLDDAVIEDWAGATLALSAVNAGPACIVAFWRACSACGAASLPAVAAGGRAGAELCGMAGARATLACLEALPTAIRLAGTVPGGLAGWWQGLLRLAREAPALVQGVAARAAFLLADGDGAGFADFVAAGLKTTVNDKVRRAAFFALEDPLARALLERRSGLRGFGESERMAGAFVAGLWGGPPRLKLGSAEPVGAGRRTMIASQCAFLPPVFPGFPAAEERLLYRAAAAHAYAHLAVPPVRHAILQLKPLQRALVGLIEDARVESIAIGQFPGLRRLWAGFHRVRPGGAVTVPNLMARLARGLLDPGYDDPDGIVQKGRALFAAAALDDPTMSRVIGGLLGNDLGQIRLQFNAPTYVVEPAYRDDNMHLWELPEVPDDAMSLMVEAARPRDGTGDGHGGDAPAPRARQAGQHPGGVVLATYPEWDASAQVERADWTTLRDMPPVLRDPEREGPEMAALRAQVARLVRSSVVATSAWQSRQEQGEELDLDAVIAAAIALRGGLHPDPRVYRDRRRLGRDLATLVILDVSQSTAAIGAGRRSVLASERLAVSMLASALAVNGDTFALRAFASVGRENVRLTRLKDFDEALTPAVEARLAGLLPGLSTRLGAALRHSGAELAPQRADRKMILVLTDGEPSDIDVADPQDLVEDARRAVLNLRAAGIDVFGIVIDPQGAGSGSAIFGRHNTMLVRRLDELPSRLAGIYFRLAQR